MIVYKTKAEIDTMARAGKMLSQVLEQAQKWAVPGITTKELDTKIDDMIVSLGGEPGFKKVKGYYWASCICINEQIVHTPPSSRVIEAGDVVTIDSGVYLNGLHTDSAVTIEVGTKTDEVQHFLETGKVALKNALKKAKIGNYVGDISRELEFGIESQGYTIVSELTGHGVGAELHEDPLIPCFVDKPRTKTPQLKKGMTLAIEVMYTTGKDAITHEKDGWSLIVRDGSISACFEHTIGLWENKALILA